MNQQHYRLNAPVLMLAVLLMSVIGYQSFAMRTLAMMKPAVIATVDLETVFNALDQRSLAEERLRNETQRMIDSNKQKEDGDETQVFSFTAELPF